MSADDYRPHSLGLMNKPLPGQVKRLVTSCTNTPKAWPAGTEMSNLNNFLVSLADSRSEAEANYPKLNCLWNKKKSQMFFFLVNFQRMNELCRTNVSNSRKVSGKVEK